MLEKGSLTSILIHFYINNINISCNFPNKHFSYLTTQLFAYNLCGYIFITDFCRKNVIPGNLSLMNPMFLQAPNLKRPCSWPVFGNSLVRILTETQTYTERICLWGSSVLEETFWVNKKNWIITASFQILSFLYIHSLSLSMLYSNMPHVVV
jgi:hypothetical protein